MKQLLTTGMVCLALFVGLASPVSATSITKILPEYTGIFANFGFPLPPVTVGTFNYIIPVGDTIVSAVISGTTGNSESNSSAPVDVNLDGLFVGQCIPFSPCFFGPANPIPWSYTFAPSEFSLLSDGTAELTAVQTFWFVIQLGQTTLQIETQSGSTSMPEPSTILLLGSGLVGLIGYPMKKAQA